MFPLGIEAWCEHRRTGYPKFLPIMDNKGVGITNLTLGIRRLSYPAEEYQLNAGKYARCPAESSMDKITALPAYGGTAIRM